MLKKSSGKGIINVAIIIIIIVMLVGGIIAWQALKAPKEEKNLNKETVNIPQECQQFQEDICSLFSCMVKQCWCDERIMPNPVLNEGKNNIFNGEEAISAVKQYLQNTNSEYIEVKSATRLNDFFFNVFAYNDEEEKVFTVGANGVIFLTVCGI